MNQSLTIHHDLAGVVITPLGGVDTAHPAKTIHSALNQYQDEELIPARVIHEEARERYGAYYLSPGFNLRAYRLRADLTQAMLARQMGIPRRRLSEMENGKREITEMEAKQFATALRCE